MKLKILFITASLLIVYSCNEQREQTHDNRISPKVAKAYGYIVPQNSIATPKSVPAGKPNVVNAGKPKVVPAYTKRYLAGIPKTVIAGIPKISTPGKDNFSLPIEVKAIDSPFVAGIPEMVLAKYASSKDKNAQNFSSFSKLQGLRSGVVASLIQDKKGNIWIGTYGGGVSRYDGKNFTHFTEKEGLLNNLVWPIFEDRAGNLWFGAVGGVSRYDGKNFTNFTKKEGLIDNGVTSICEDRSGTLWFGTHKGVSRYDGIKFTNYTKKEGLSNKVQTILVDTMGNLWFGTEDGVSIFDGESFTNFTVKEGLANNYVQEILQDKKGIFWIGTEGGLSRYDGMNFTNFTEKEGLGSNNVWSMSEDNSGNLWVGSTESGVSRFDGRYFTHFTEEEGLANNMVHSILVDNSGGLWFGTESGISKYNGYTFTQFTRNEGLISDEVNSITEDTMGNIWIATNGGGVSKYDGTSFTNLTEKDGLAENGAHCILEDSSGYLWFGHHRKGVSIYDGKNFTNFTEKEGLIDNEVISLFQDRSGNIWMGTWRGVSRYDGNNFTNYTEKEGLSNNIIWNIFEDKAGNFWFGTHGGGVTKFDPDEGGTGGSFTHYTVKEGLSGNIVLGIIEDNAGNLWIGTNGGVSKYDPDEGGTGGSFTHFTEKEGLSNDEVYGAIKDKSGNLWFGTNFGLNKLTPESLLKLSASALAPARGTPDKGGLSDNPDNHSSENVLFKTYSYEDGFLAIGCKENAIYQDRNGTIWIGAKDRLTAFHPEGDKRDTIAPNMQLTGVALFNENIPWANLAGKKDTSIVLGNGVRVRNFKFDGTSNWYYIPEHLSLPWNNNYLTFNFIGITTNSPQKVKYQYKLEGVDDNWSALTIRAEAPYGNLPPGNYSFKVKAMNSEGYWSKEINYSFTIRPPWWQTWWAYTLYLLVFVAAVSSFIAYRSRKLRLENKMLEEKVGLRTIQLEQKSTELEKSLDNLKSTQAQLIHSEKMASLGELTAGIAHEIQNPLNFVNNFSEVNKELIAEMKQEIKKGNFEEVNFIANDIEDNEAKISQHGKRADAIVKGMLQHSQSSTGRKEQTDINKLAEDYFLLAYHGLRAKDNTFNATLNRDFDESIDRINIIPQDIGRVLLNLFNNAFYAVMEKSKIAGENYEPSVVVRSKHLHDKIEIRVRDNGIGIPKEFLDKIFQPFFTTKPTGQGTGLGLSLSYDIIKAHGGDLKVENNQIEGAEFIISLPLG